MCNKMYVKSLFMALTMLAVLMVSQGQAVNRDIADGATTTWSDATGVNTGDIIYVTNGSTLDITGDLSEKVPASISLGDSTGGPAGTGTLELSGASKFKVDDLFLGVDSAGILTISSNSTLTVNDAITLKEGTITNNGLLSWITNSITWNNAAATDLVFAGSGTTVLGNVDGHSFQIDSGTIMTSGDLNANDFVLNGGTLTVGGALTLDTADLSTVGTTINLSSGASWTLAAGQDAAVGKISISGGALTLGADTDYNGTAGKLTFSSGTIDLDGHNLNLDDVGDASQIVISDGVRFIGGGELSWSAGTLRATTNTFYSNLTSDNVSLNLSGGSLEVYGSGSNNFTYVNDLTLSGAATVTGSGATVVVQSEANINTSGTNTANFVFLGRNGDSTTITTGIFDGTIDLQNGETNQIDNGTFNNTVSISNAGDTSTGQDIAAGTGLTTISNGTFNETVTLSLYRKTDEEDENNKVTITAGDFKGLLKYQGLADVVSTDADGNTTTTVRMGNAIINGGTFDSLELVAGSGSGKLTIAETVEFSGADGVDLNAAILSISDTKTLTVSAGDFLMDTNGTGKLTGSGTLDITGVDKKLYLKSGSIAGSVTIKGDVVQSGGTITPGAEAGDIATITFDNNLNFMNATIDAKQDGTCDTITVGGTMTFEEGAKITVNTDYNVGDLTEGITYTVFNSTGGFDGEVENCTIDLGVAGFSGIGAINSTANTKYDITVQRSIREFTAGAYNANNFTNYLYDLYDAGEHQEKVMAALASDSNQQLAAEKLSGEGHQTSLQALMNAGMMRLNTLTQQIRPTMSSQYNQGGLAADTSEMVARGQTSPVFRYPRFFEENRVWYAAYGMGGAIKGDENTSPTGVSFAGMMVGLEGVYDAGSAKVGLYYDGSGVQTDEKLLASKTKVKTNYFGAYYTRQIENGYRMFTFGFGEDRYTSRRYLNIGSGTDAISELAKGGYHGWQSTLYAERGWDSMKRFYGMQPYFGLQYNYIRRNAFQEKADMVAAGYTNYAMLDMESANYNSLRTYIGARWETPFYQIGQDPSTGMMLGGTFQIQTAWIHEMLDKTVPINSAQLGGSTLSNSFVVEGADCGRDWYLLSFGTKWQMAKAFSFYGDYSVLLNEEQTFHTGSGGVCLAW